MALIPEMNENQSSSSITAAAICRLFNVIEKATGSHRKHYYFELLVDGNPAQPQFISSKKQDNCRVSKKSGPRTTKKRY
ncbi:MAG: hypothetical protein V7709_15165, partial [Halioglobus sp.]